MSANDALILSIPTHASSVAFNRDKACVLAVGAEDGTIRLYRLPETKVYKAIRGLSGEVTSIVFSSENEDEVWIACGRQAISFHMDCSKLILNRDDIQSSIEIGLDDEDVLNDISLSATNSFLAFSSDSGAVGVINLATKSNTRMKTSHQSICGTVSFISDRPNEIVSGGYDCALLHFDFKQGSVLSRYDLTPPAPSSGISLSPPFILSISLSPNGLIVAGTADGQIWFGFGGSKDDAGLRKVKGKRSRKWGGLDASRSFVQKVEEGPIVGLLFTSINSFISCTLLGKLTIYKVDQSFSEASKVSNVTEASNNSEFKTLKPIGHFQARGCAKVNAIAYHANSRCLAVAGLDKDGKKGVVELLYNLNILDEEQSHL